MDYLAQAELEAEYWGRYDYLSEAYGATARDADLFAEGEDERDREEHEVEVAAFGPYVAVLDDLPF